MCKRTNELAVTKKKLIVKFYVFIEAQRPLCWQKETQNTKEKRQQKFLWPFLFCHSLCVTFIYLRFAQQQFAMVVYLTLVSCFVIVAAASTYCFLCSFQSSNDLEKRVVATLLTLLDGTCFCTSYLLFFVDVLLCMFSCVSCALFDGCIVLQGWATRRQQVSRRATVRQTDRAAVCL